MRTFKNLFVSSLILLPCLSGCGEQSLIRSDTNMSSISIIEPEGFSGIIETGKFNEAGLKIQIEYENGTKATTDLTESFIPESYKYLLNEPGEHTIDILFRGNEVSFTFLMDNFYDVYFYNEGELLYTDHVQNGHEAYYMGPTPTKETTQEYSYSFAGWDCDLSDIIEDTYVNAIFDEMVRYYTVTWDVDGVITSEMFEYGTFPFFNGSTEKEADSEYTYDFIGWSPSISEVTEDITYTALYSSSLIAYISTITFETNGGNYISPITGPEGEHVVLPSPTKDNCAFVGWFMDEELTEEALIDAMPGEDMILYAKWIEMYKVFEMYSNEYIYFGSYPQTIVSNEYLKSKLEKINSTNTNGYYEFNGNEYQKVLIKVNYTGSYYSNGDYITNNVYEYFKVEPILWKVTKKESGKYTLLSDQALDAHNFQDYKIYTNNYADSSIRAWLNSDFINSAFVPSESNVISTTNVDNSVGSTREIVNPYVCDNTDDKVYLFSAVDYFNNEYGFINSSDKICKPTDYSLAKNCFITTDGELSYEYEESCYYWTRSPANDDPQLARAMTRDGYLTSASVVIKCGIRPALNLNLSQIVETPEIFESGAYEYLYYGSYPQSVVTDESLISSLDELTSTNSKGYYEYGGEQYEKLIATPYKSTYTFNNGEKIESQNVYYFKVEPILWRCLSGDGLSVFLASECILDNRRYDNHGSNNYMDSEIRNWLNNDFLEKAFGDDSLIETTAVDNSVTSTVDSSNPYVCETTYDKVFLLSREELSNADYGFSTNLEDLDIARQCKTTEYSRAKGIMCSMSENYLYNGVYWTRSPVGMLYNNVYYAGSGGQPTAWGGVWGNECGVRPSLTLRIA